MYSETLVGALSVKKQLLQTNKSDLQNSKPACCWDLILVMLLHLQPWRDFPQ